MNIKFDVKAESVRCACVQVQEPTSLWTPHDSLVFTHASVLLLLISDVVPSSSKRSASLYNIFAC